MIKKQITYKPQGGVCSQEIRIETKGDIVTKVEVVKGCHGNSQGVAALLKDMRIEEAINRLDGIRCRGLMTSCPDQIAQALKQINAK